MNVVEIIKASFGWGVLLVLGFLAWHIVHGEVSENTSFGLMPIVVGLTTLGGAYAQWAFGARIPMPPSDASKALPSSSPPPAPPATRS